MHSREPGGAVSGAGFRALGGSGVLAKTTSGLKRKTRPKTGFKCGGPGGDSNPRPSDYESPALPTELQARETKKWCPEGDSNPHSLRKQILNLPCLPISPPGRGVAFKMVPRAGLEPARPEEQSVLSAVCLPISPSGQSVAPRTGFEPVTQRLTVACSTD